MKEELTKSDSGNSDALPVKATVPGVQTIGMIGSLSTPSTPAAQMRQGPALSQVQQRLGQQSLVRAASPSSNQSLFSQRFQGHATLRGPSIITAPNTQPPQSTQSLHQQFLQSQQKQPNQSSPYRPPIRPPTIQQRPQHQIPLTSQQQKLQQQQLILQHTQPSSLPNQSLQPIPPNQRSIIPTTPKLNVQALAPPGPNNDDDDMSDDIISRKRIRELVTQVDRSETLGPEIEDDLLEIADDFVESIVTAACHLAKHRKSTTLEAKDILLHAERHWNITLPGFSSDEIKCYKKPSTNDIHKERLAMIKKSMAGSHDNAKTPASGQAAANPKPNSAKTPGSP